MKKYDISPFNPMKILCFHGEIRIGCLFPAVIVNFVFLLYLIFYILLNNSSNHILQFFLHVSIMLILFVIPGFATAPLIRRVYNDIIHFGAYILALSTISVFLLKLLLNILNIPISAMTFFAIILVYTNIFLLLQKRIFSHLQKQYTQISGFIETQEVSKRKCSFNFNVFLMLIVICMLLLVATEHAAMTIPLVRDRDCWYFGTYNIR